MGSWGNGSFENDEALDWVWLLDDDEAGNVPRDTLRVVADMRDDEEPEAPECERALAAAEVVAAARGRPAPVLPPEVTAWLDLHRERVTPELEAIALRAVARIRDRSELRELWQEGSEFHAWFGMIAILESRLGRPGKLMAEIVQTHETWDVLAGLGVRDGAILQFDFSYQPAPEKAARELAEFLRAETDYEVRVEATRSGFRGKTWHVEGQTRPMPTDLGRLQHWVTWMFVAGQEHGPCELDGWGTPVPQSP